MSRIRTFLARLRRDRRGMTTVEYVIALCLVGAAGVTVWSEFGGMVKARLGSASTVIGTTTDNAMKSGQGGDPNSGGGGDPAAPAASGGGGTPGVPGAGDLQSLAKDAQGG